MYSGGLPHAERWPSTRTTMTLSATCSQEEMPLQPVFPFVIRKPTSSMALSAVRWRWILDKAPFTSPEQHTCLHEDHCCSKKTQAI